MPKFEPLSLEKFHEVLASWKIPPQYDHQYLYDLHLEALAGLGDFLDAHPSNPIRYVNPIMLTLYCFHEHMYFASKTREELRGKLQQDDQYTTRIISAAIDKYLTNEHLEYREEAVKSRYYPPLTTLKLYVNTINGLLSGFQSRQPQETLLTDITKKCFSLLTCVLDLLISGFETEAFSTWRTLHESEAILTILYRDQIKAIPAYLKHLQYGLAFHHLIEDKEKTDKMFDVIKTEMRARDLKSKDMKKFIEYGWLFHLADLGEVRLNFRDGIQKLAGLSSYSKAYEMSSEITHSSPLLIYSKRQTFYNLSLIYSYETFFRIEKIFHQTFVPQLKKEAQAQYAGLRQVYYAQLIQFHKIESGTLISSNKPK
ncbi:MAG TPA: DUF5677 domain-containing protein [Bacilli bacterium]|nr:DUF5677 domain-containing protein [Bacilli bacterium]